MDAIARRLLFRIGAMGFCLNLNELVEIREQVAGRIDCTQSDHQLSIIGALSFRQTMVPVVDLTRRLGISSDAPDIVLLLNSRAGNWGLLVDRVEGFFPSAEMIDRPVPCLLQADGWRCFNQIALHAEEPFLRLDLSSCYDGGKG